MIIQLVLVDGIAYRLGPEAKLTGDGLHFIDEVVVKGGANDLLAERDEGNSGDCDECDFHLCIIPVRVLDRFGLEWDFGTKLGGGLRVLEDCIARSDFVLINFEKGRRATLVEHVANDGNELIPLVDDGGGLVDHRYFFFASDEYDG